jgi:hypothetical protein
MPTLTLNGARLPVRLVEVEVRKLKLDAANPRLHSSYLTHDLPAQPSQSQLAQALEQLPEFQSLHDALVRNEGSFQPPLVTLDLRVLEGNRRVAALRRLRAAHPRQSRWEAVTVHQLTKRVSDAQEKALRAKFHLEGMLAWDGLSQLMEYVAVAERDGADQLAVMLGRFPRQLEPLLVAGRCVRHFSAAYPQVRSQELLWILVGLCGVRRIEPEVVLSRAQRCIFTDNDDERPTQQPFPLAQVLRWLVEGRFTRPYAQADGRQTQLRPAQLAAAFRRVRQAGEETLAYFLEPDGSLSKAVAFLDSGQETLHWRRKQAINLTHKYLDLLNQLKAIRRDENPELHREAVACYHRLEQLLGIRRR